MIKISLVIGGMGVGGAERVMSILANYWATHGWEVTLITLVDRSKPPFYPLDPQIKLVQLGVTGDSSNPAMAVVKIWQRARVLRQAIIASAPDVTIGFMATSGVMSVLACWNLGIPVIVSKRIYPAMSEANKVWKQLMKWTYPFADLVVVLTKSALSFYPPEQGYRAVVLPNPVIVPPVTMGLEGLLPTPTLIAVGRLAPQKGFDLLITAFAKIQADYPDWHLTILGEGESRAELEQLRSQLQLTDRVHLPGKVTNVHDYLRQADIFVMSSRCEGFPNALCEAMACGLPVISTDCLSGPREIITDGVDGILVATEDVEALAVGLDRLMSNPIERQQLAHAAPQVLDRFGLEPVMKMWTDTVKQVVERRTKSR
jgi:GalNAc-alpha-(1->4)-GalNAc-alpha-(1->3)-diNAcBac-PP-undecaprenol alpha-1,4-N-acetyl-D-galactosaminyltransferase